jgi:hypothetical protein
MSDYDFAAAAVRKWLAAQELAVRTAKRYESRDHPKRVTTRQQSVLLEHAAVLAIDALPAKEVVIDGVRYWSAMGGWGSSAIVASPVEEVKS